MSLRTSMCWHKHALSRSLISVLSMIIHWWRPRFSLLRCTSGMGRSKTSHNSKWSLEGEEMKTGKIAWKVALEPPSAGSGRVYGALEANQVALLTLP
jgi:hypothetical protein